MRRLDAVVVGSGPNGLAAAITLASHGLSVRVLEAAPDPGGGLATRPLTLPGFAHDVCSAIHPLGVGSPLFEALPLARHGLRWVHPLAPLAHPLDDEPAVIVERSLGATAAGLGMDGSAYRGLFAPLVEGWERAIDPLLGPLPPSATALHAARWAWLGLASARRVSDASFVGRRARALFAGLAAHSIVPLERPPSAAVGLVLGAAAHRVGWPFPAGGAASLARALVSLLEALGGEVVCDRPVRSLLELPPARVTLLDLAPAPAAALVGDAFPGRYRRALARYRHGPGAYKLDWALSHPIPWRDPACARAGTVHVGGSFEEIAAAERAPWRDRVADRPFVLLAQPSRFDEGRAPPGRHTAWAYCHVPPGCTADVTARIEAQIERFAPGFGDCVIARSVLGPRDLERHNPNLVGGDVGGGALTLRQAVARPALRLDPYATPLPGVFLCSAATPPGGGVHGMCGFHAARSALRRRFGMRVGRRPRLALGARLRAVVESGILSGCLPPSA